MTRGFVLLSLLAAFASGGCRSNDVLVSTTIDPLTIFPAEATYVWDEAGSTAPSDPRLAPLRMPELVKEESDRAFSSRGYRPVGSEPADFRLSYQLRVSTIIQADASQSRVGLWLTLSEAASGRKVWAGAGEAALHVGLEPEERRRRLRAALERMLENFPPAQRG